MNMQNAYYWFFAFLSRFTFRVVVSLVPGLGFAVFAIVSSVYLAGNAKAATATKVALTTSVTSISVGSNLVITATVTPSAAKGLVTFKDGSTNIGSATLTSGKASITTNFDAVGTHKLTAVYAGSATYTTSTSTTTSVLATAVPTSTVVSSSSTGMVKGQSAVLTASIIPTAASGSVTFKDGSATLGTSSISAGKATFSLPSGFSTTGTHNITATYSGAATYITSTSQTLKITVSALTSTVTTLSVPDTTLYIGQAANLTAKVSPTAATGSVTFRDGSTVLGTSALNSGVAVLSVASGFANAGVHGLVAQYEGNPSYASSFSALVNKLVTSISTSSALIANPPTVSINQTVALAVTITPSSATGTVTFKEGARAIGSVPVTGGKASINHVFSAAGLKTISATYGGDAAYFGSTAAALSYSVTGTPASISAPAMSLRPEVAYDYDVQGNMTRVTRSPNNTGFAFSTTITPDVMNRPSTITDAAGGQTIFVYNGVEWQDNVQDPRGKNTRYTKNGFGEVTSFFSPDTGTTALSYDASGNLLTERNARGIQANYQYDALNRLISSVYSDNDNVPSQIQTFVWTYDQTGPMFSNGVGRLTTASFPEGSTSFSYDMRGRVKLRRQAIKSSPSANVSTLTHDTEYSYNDSGQLASMTYPSGRRLTVSYANGVPTSLGLAKDSESPAKPILTELRFAAFGEAQSWNWEMLEGPQKHERFFDTTGRMIRYPLGDLLRDVTYDPASRISSYKHYLQKSGAVAPAFDQQFLYDPLDRLLRATTAEAEWSYTYDQNGNRTSLAINGGNPGIYEIEERNNQVFSISSPAIKFKWDNAGNATTDGNFLLNYDPRGRLASLIQGASKTNYDYDSRGQRVRKTRGTAGETTIFIYDLNGVLLGEYDDQGKPIREYIWLGGIPIAVFMPAPAQSANLGSVEPLVYYIQTDHINTPRVVVDQSNVIRWRWMAEPFGSTPADESPSGLKPFVFNLRFPGQYYDSESGIHQNWHRDYIPGIGRYAQSDPIGLAGGLNTYSYVLGNPLSYFDPTGLIKIPGIPGADGETTVHANPGPQATTFRPDHGPDHIHLGKNDGPRVRTSDFQPLTEDDARRMSRKQKNFCEGLTDVSKDKIRKAQNSIFKHGRIILSIGGGMTSIAAACRADPIWCAEQIEVGNLP